LGIRWFELGNRVSDWYLPTEVVIVLRLQQGAFCAPKRSQRTDISTLGNQGNAIKMAKSRLSMRREAEAAEAKGEAPVKKKKVAKKKAAKKKAAARPRKKKSEVPPRRRLVWVVYSSTMREEGRFLYHERDKAEERLNSLLSKGKRRYFIQPIKEALDSEGNPMVPDEERSKKMDMEDDAPPVADPDADTDAEVEADADTETDDVPPVVADDAED